MNEELKALRKEIAELRSRVDSLLAVVEKDRAVPVIDWSRPLQVGSPRFVPASAPLPPGTITCSADARQ